jgi:hypothetical protein
VAALRAEKANTNEDSSQDVADTPRKVHHVTNFPKIKSKMIAPMYRQVFRVASRSWCNFPYLLTRVVSSLN